MYAARGLVYKYIITMYVRLWSSGGMIGLGRLDIFKPTSPLLVNPKVGV